MKEHSVSVIIDHQRKWARYDKITCGCIKTNSKRSWQTQRSHSCG